MKKTFCERTDVFLGSSTIDLPTAERLAASWFFIKGITGNTHPGATLPFGKYSCCTYTSAYPTGYGCNWTNSCPWDMRHFPEGARFKGLSHFHQSGTGAIGLYYNFALIIPYTGDRPEQSGEDILEEKACPGYYSVRSRAGKDSILSEATVSSRSVYHCFTFPQKGGKIRLDLTNDGLNRILTGEVGKCLGGKIKILGDSDVSAELNLDERVHYFRLHFDGASVKCLLHGEDRLSDNEVSFETVDPHDFYGAELEASGTTVLSRFSDSLVSADRADADISADEGGFDAVRKAADRIWEDMLGKIEIDCDDPSEQEKFYSNLYQSLVKPSDRPKDSPIWPEDTYMVDFATMWDIYKTQLPLIFTLYPETGEKIIESFRLYEKHTGAFPHAVMVGGKTNWHWSQASMLAEYSICDAFWRGIKADYKSLMESIRRDMQRPEYADIIAGKLPIMLTHWLDITEACGDVADMADALGLGDDAQKLRKVSERWSEAFDPATGLLRKDDHWYYEGNHWNYSFRLLRHMKKRMDIVGRDAYIDLLDRFFGFKDPMDMSGRFEGFNNESDMEAPFAYHAAGRMDRIAAIMDAMHEFIFTTGRGGIPGNNDSGALSSLYVWNVLGIFPVTGQNRMLIGSPRYKKAVLHLPKGKDFTIVKEGEGGCVIAAELDGEPLADFSFTASRMMQGGTLVLHTEAL